FLCPTCKTVLQATPGQAGMTVSCPKCKYQMQVPVPARSIGSLIPQASQVPSALPTNHGQAQANLPRPAAPDELKFPVIAMLIVSGLSLLLSSLGVLGIVLGARMGVRNETFLAFAFINSLAATLAALRTIWLSLSA